jgi:hypothetical protein
MPPAYLKTVYETGMFQYTLILVTMAFSGFIVLLLCDFIMYPPQFVNTVVS